MPPFVGGSDAKGKGAGSPGGIYKGGAFSNPWTQRQDQKQGGMLRSRGGGGSINPIAPPKTPTAPTVPSGGSSNGTTAVPAAPPVDPHDATYYAQLAAAQKTASDRTAGIEQRQAYGQIDLQNALKGLAQQGAKQNWNLTVRENRSGQLAGGRFGAQLGELVGQNLKAQGNATERFHRSDDALANEKNQIANNLLNDIQGRLEPAALARLLAHPPGPQADPATTPVVANGGAAGVAGGTAGRGNAAALAALLARGRTRGMRSRGGGPSINPLARNADQKGVLR